MSTLVVDEFKDEILRQPFSIRGSIVNSAAIKAMIYVHNMPEGVFTMSLRKGIALVASWDFTCEDLRDSFGGISDYFHVIYPFFKPSGIRLDRGDYFLELSSVGYTYQTSAWIGWAKDWQGYQGKILGGEPSSFINYPYSYRIYEYRDANK